MELKCPYCGDTDVSTEASEVDYDEMTVCENYHCHACGSEFGITYNMVVKEIEKYD